MRIKRGIGPAYMDKVGRSGIRVGDLLDFEAFEEKLTFNLQEKAKILGKTQEWVESAKAETTEEYRDYAKRIEPFVTDTSLMGTYPYGTSSNPTAGGVCAGLGIGPTMIHKVIGVVKAYVTRVGAGPFPTELPTDMNEQIRQKGEEFGATTGRPRQCGWFDAVAARYAVRVNSFTSIAITKLDILDELESMKLCVGYRYNGKTITEFPSQIHILENCEPVYESMEGWRTDTSELRKYQDLPEKARKYVERISQLMETKVEFVAMGPGRDRIVSVDRSSTV